jgi:hypothetical protein
VEVQTIGTTLPPFSQLIEQARRRWAPLRRALSSEDRAAFDRMVACATQQLRAVVRLGRLWRGEAVLVAVLLAQEKRVEEMASVVARRVEKLVAGEASHHRAHALGVEPVC